MVKRILAILLSVIMAVGLLSSCSENKKESSSELSSPSGQSAPMPSVSDVKQEFRITTKIDAPSLKNNLVEEPDKQGIDINLPADYYTSGKNYPVLYFLPGFGDSYESYGNSFMSALNDLREEKKINEMIVVCINGTNKLNGSFYVNSPVIGNWEDFVIKDVLQYIDGNYRTIKDPDARGLAGHSMGGFGALNIAMRNKDLYNYVYSMSPGVFAPDGFPESSVYFDFIIPYPNEDEATARASYLEKIKALPWPDDFSYAYGSAFAYDEKGKAPYLKMPAPNKSGNPQEKNGKFLKDNNYALWEAGYGNISGKVKTHKENLLNLKGLVIDYGKSDSYKWIPKGCDYFSEELKKNSIPHELVPYEGDHQARVVSRIKSDVLPFFSQAFGTLEG